MFNEAEIDIFNHTKLHIVFFGEVLVGARLPCLTYMLTFKDMEERNANWAQFSADPDWKKISQAPEYANSVSRIQRVFLEPLAFSQI
ncbi:NIPSNAP family protein [Pseudarcicella hirudinis]